MKKFLKFLIPIFICVIVITIMIIVKSKNEDIIVEEENVIKVDNIVNYGITLKYLDKNSNQMISKNEDLYYEMNELYDFSNIRKNIDGYVFINVDGNEKGIVNASKLNIIYYYAKKATVVVKCFEKDTNKLLKQDKAINGYEGKEITYKSQVINGYKFEFAEANKTMNSGENVVSLFYSKIPEPKNEIQVD